MLNINHNPKLEINRRSRDVAKCSSRLADTTLNGRVGPRKIEINRILIDIRENALRSLTIKLQAVSKL